MSKKEIFSDYGDVAMSFFSTGKRDEPPANEEHRETPVPGVAMRDVPKDPKPPRRSKNENIGIPEGYKVDPRFVEMKTKRVQLVFQPSFYQKMKEKADALGLFFNEYATQALAAFEESQEHQQTTKSS